MKPKLLFHNSTNISLRLSYDIQDENQDKSWLLPSHSTFAPPDLQVHFSGFDLFGPRDTEKM